MTQKKAAKVKTKLQELAHTEKEGPGLSSGATIPGDTIIAP